LIGPLRRENKGRISEKRYLKVLGFLWAVVLGDMGPHGLMPWPGNSGENVKEKLRKDLKFVGHSEKKKCGKLPGIVYPVVDESR